MASRTVPGWRHCCAMNPSSAPSGLAAPPSVTDPAPLVSVVLPAFNAAGTIAAAVRSILDDGLEDIELIVIDDGSTDATRAILGEIADRRLTVIAQPRNLGLPRALNSGLEAARARFVARMDADDISLPGRLAAQVRAFSADPGLIFCGTGVRIVDADGLSDSRLHAPPLDPEDTRQEMWFRTAVLHPTVMFDRARVPEAALHYLEALRVRQDHELFLRLLDHGEGRNLPDILLDYRRHPGAATIARAAVQARSRRIVVAKAFEQRGLLVSRNELDAHMALCPKLPGEIALRLADRAAVWAWGDRLMDLGERLGIRDRTRWRSRIDCACEAVAADENGGPQRQAAAGVGDDIVNDWALSEELDLPRGRGAT